MSHICHIYGFLLGTYMPKCNLHIWHAQYGNIYVPFFMGCFHQPVILAYDGNTSLSFI